ncbi:MAG: MobV family relaxase [Clostridium sp.]
MAHLMKHTKGSCTNLLRHFERNENIQEYSNENINFNKSHMNYNLAPVKENQLEFINKRCKDLKVLNRKDVNVMCTWVITLPKDLDWDKQSEFFAYSYRFMSERYGEENVISSYVHLDENRPHMHFAFVPVVYDDKKNKFKVSAKECVTRYDLNTFHKDLNNHLEKYGLECSVINNATVEGNKTVKELKLESKLKNLSENIKHTEHSLTIHEKAFKEINDIDSIKYKKTFLGGNIALKNDDYFSIVSNLKNLKIENAKLKKEILEKNKKIDGIKEFNSYLTKENDCLTDRSKRILNLSEKEIEDKAKKIVENKFKDISQENNTLKKAILELNEEIRKLKHYGKTTYDLWKELEEICDEYREIICSNKDLKNMYLQVQKEYELKKENEEKSKIINQNKGMSM